MTSHRELPAFLRAPITDLESACLFVEALDTAGLSWHFDDDPTDALSRTGLSHEDMVFLGAQRDLLFKQDWMLADGPHGYALHVQAVRYPYLTVPEWRLPDDWRTRKLTAAEKFDRDGFVALDASDPDRLFSDMRSLLGDD